MHKRKVIIMIKGSFTFHGIGQGLFYSGKIQNNTESFKFVYDCGTLYKKDSPLLTSEITSCFGIPHREKETIHALFISHLHYDHISGLPDLLEKYTVKNIFLPYFSPEEMLLLGIKNDIASNPELLTLFVNPPEYFAKYDVENVYLISPTSLEGNLSEEDYCKIMQNTETNHKGSLHIDGQIQPISVINKTVIYTGKKISFSDYHSIWTFRIYQDQAEKQQEEIRKEIINTCNIDPDKLNPIELERLIQKEATIKDVQKIYNKVKHKINQSSLVLYHGPCESKNGNNTYYNNRCCCPYPDCVNPFTSPATLLTGDINLNLLSNNGNKLEDFLLETPYDVGFFQIPHHGSYKNMSLSILNKIFPTYMEKICSYGKHNQFRHPDAYTLDKIIQNSTGRIYHVVQNQGFRYDIVINCCP